MTRHAFYRYDLRTTAPEAATLFYADVAGLDFAESSSTLGVWPLHEQARARGAPAHWLGHIGVADVEAAARRLVEPGGERLGPTVRANDGTTYAGLRDPFGAVLSVRASTQTPLGAPVRWHQHHTRDLDRSWALYAEIFGWARTETVDVPDPEGGHRLFAWEPGGASVGSMANTARWPGVHAQWLFYFPVADLDAALEKVRARGGTVIAAPAVLAPGVHLAPCADGQGAAFGLCG